MTRASPHSYWSIPTTTSFPRAARSGLASRPLPKRITAFPTCWKSSMPRARRSSGSSTPCIIATARATTRRGNTLRPFRRAHGNTRASNSAHGAASSAPSLYQSLVKSSPQSIGAPVASPNTDLDLQLKKHGIHQVIVIGLIAHTCIEATVRYAAELGYQVTLVKDATADYSDEMMHAAL